MVTSITLGSVTLTATVGAASSVGVSIEDNSTGVQTNHNWSITTNQNDGLDIVAIDYSTTNVSVGLSADDVEVSINGTAKTVGAVNVDGQNVSIGLSSSQSVTDGDTVRVMTTNETFGHPSSAESNLVTIGLLNGTGESATTFDTDSATVEIVSESSGSGTFHGYVTNSSDDPVHNATVSAQDDGGNVLNSSSTDATGYYEFNVTNGTHNLVVSHSDYQLEAQQDVQLNDSEWKEVNFSLTESSTGGSGSAWFNGTVMDKDGNVVGSGVYVAAFDDLDSEGFKELANTTTNQNGYYELNVPNGTHDVGASDGDYFGNVHNVTINDSENRTVNVQLTEEFKDRESYPPGDFQATINQVHDDVPAGEEVWIGADVTNNANEKGVQTIKLQRNGTVLDKWEDVPIPAGSTEEVWLNWDTKEGDAGDHKLNITTLNSTATADVTVLAGAGTVKGTITNDTGHAVGGAEVAVYDDTYETFRYNVTPLNGKYELQVPEGEYTVEVRTQNQGQNKTEDVKVEGGNTTVHHVSLDPPSIINGTVKNKTTNNAVSSSVARDAYIIAHTEDYSTWRWTQVKSDGTYKITAPEGNYKISVRNATGYGPKTVSQQVGANTTVTKDLNLSQPATIEGRLKMPDGTYASGGGVIVSDGSNYRFGQADSGGNFTVAVGGGTEYTVQGYYFEFSGGSGEFYYNSTSGISLGDQETKQLGNYSLQNPAIKHTELKHVGDGPQPDMSNLSMEARLEGPFMDAKLNSTTGGAKHGYKPAELSADNVTPNTEFEVTFTARDYDPNSLLWAAKDVEWESTQNQTCLDNSATAETCKDITVTTKPVHFEAIQRYTDKHGNPRHLPLGPLPADMDPQQSIEWPQGDKDQADFSRNNTVFFGMLDMPDSGGFASGFSDMTVTTNAQTFTRPQMTNGSLDIYVGAPHTTVAGNQHDGFYRAFIPQEQLDEWNISDPKTELVAKYQGNAASFEVNDTPSDGAWINLDLHYSDGYVEVGSADNVTVEGSNPANFDVSIESTNSAVVEGNALTVEAKIQNTGDVQGTGNVSLEVDGTIVDTSDDVSLNAGQQETVTLKWTGTADQMGVYQANVTGTNVTTGNTDSTDSQNVQINGQEYFKITSTDANSSKPGDTLNVSATIDNTGSAGATQEVTLDVGGETRDTRNVTIAAGSTQTIKLQWDTNSSDDGSHTATVSTANDSSSLDVSVGGGGGGGGLIGGGSGDDDTGSSVSVTIDSVPTTAAVGDSVSVSATVENTGDSSVTTPVDLEVDGDLLDSTEVTLAGGASTSVSFTFTVTEEMAGSSLDVVVSADVGQDSATVSVADSEEESDDTAEEESDDTAEEAEQADDDDGGEDEESTDDGGDAHADDSGDSVPGFGAIAALMALLISMGVLRRRE
jgi:hypothetical protein